jgi:hypothetical protein
VSVTPTGKRRLRLHFDKKLFGSRKPMLVLQMEFSGYESQHCGGGYIDNYPVKYWRDACIEDLDIGETENWEEPNGSVTA